MNIFKWEKLHAGTFTRAVILMRTYGNSKQGGGFYCFQGPDSSNASAPT